MNFIKYLIFTVFLLISYSTVTYAHGDLHERIVAVTDEIKIAPDSSYLYFKRGKLYFQHNDYNKAIQDMEAANNFGFENLQTDLIFAKSHQSLQDFEIAISYLDKIEVKSPNHVLALKTRAEIYFQQKKFRASAINYEKVIDFAIKTTPENYLLAHNSWKAIKRTDSDENAIQILNKGMETLGPIVTLIKAQQKFYIDKEDFKNALQLQEQLIERANRKEMPYYQAAKLCRDKADLHKKRIYLEKSLAAINQLPSHKQNIRAIKKLRKDIELEFKQLEAE